MACARAARTLPWRRVPRSRSRTARLATPAVTAGSAGGIATQSQYCRAAVTIGSGVREMPFWPLMILGFIYGTQNPNCERPIREADGAAWGAGDRQPRRLINDNWMRCRCG